MNENKKTDILTQFGFIGIPIIVILAAIFYSLISKDNGISPNKNDDKNPYEYNIEDLKKVDPKLVKYQEGDKLPLALNTPTAIAIQNDNIYVTGDGFITYSTENKFKIQGTPNSISVSENKNVAICFNRQILFLDNTGKEIFKIEDFPEKTLLTSIAVEGDYIYVADAGRRMILQYDKKGTLKSDIGKENKAEGIKGFIVPSANFDIIPGGDGSVWAVNPGRLQIENFTSDGRLRSSWNSPVIGIEGFSGCCNPAHIALLPNGDFVTAEKNIVRVKVYDATGKFKCVVATPQQFADNAKILDIATDSEGKIYILDSKTKGIRVFIKK